MKQAGIKVLIVDDEVALANTLAPRLKMRDLQVETAYDGEEAMNKIEVNDKSINFLIGQVLRATGSKADPNKVRDLIKKN